MLDRTGALIGEQRSSHYRKGVLLVVVFEILLSYIKTFYYRPRRSQPPPGPTCILCNVFALALGLNFKDLGL